MSRTLALAELTRRESVARDTVILHLAIELDERPRPGQFAMIHPLVDACLLPRPFSILDHDNGMMRILVKDVGVGSRALCTMEPGSHLRVFGPLGRPFDVDSLRARPLVMVAGGVGIVPLHLLGRELAKLGAPPRLSLFGARMPEDLPRNLLTEAGPPWELWVESGANGETREGLVTRGLEEALARWPDAAVVSCGPTPMMKAVAKLCHAAGRDLWLCLEEQMGCGAGVCRACVVPDAREPRMRTVCKEGPVFHVSEIDYA